jgi:hypothetical protein
LDNNVCPRGVLICNYFLIVPVHAYTLHVLFLIGQNWSLRCLYYTQWNQHR